MNRKNIVLVTALLGLVGCGSSSEPSQQSDICSDLTTGGFSCDAMLDELVTVGVQPVVQSLETRLVALDAAMTTYCSDVNVEASLAAAQEAWTSAMAPMQQLHVMNFGPNSNRNEGLAAFYNTSASPLNIDIAIAKSATIDGVGLSQSANEKDLIALEYILFAPGDVRHTSDDTVNNWSNGKTSTEIQIDRCAYGKLVSADLVTRAGMLKTAWSTYSLTDSFSSGQIAANIVSNALYDVDLVTKERVKAPLFNTGEDDVDFNVDELESKIAYKSKEHIENNIIGAKTLLQAGFDDYLTALEQEEIATNMDNALQEVLDNIAEIDGTLKAALESASITTSACDTLRTTSGLYDDTSSDLAVYCALEYNLGSFTSLLKNDFIMALSFSAPSGAEGEND